MIALFCMGIFLGGLGILAYGLAAMLRVLKPSSPSCRPIKR